MTFSRFDGYKVPIRFILVSPSFGDQFNFNTTASPNAASADDIVPAWGYHPRFGSNIHIRGITPSQGVTPKKSPLLYDQRQEHG